VQPETSEATPSVQATSRALERLRLSEELRDDGLVAHTYDRRDEDLETVYAFTEAYGQLPPPGYWRRLWWWLSGAGG
jgi:hypothetical protein